MKQEMEVLSSTFHMADGKVKNFYYINHTQENIVFCIEHKIPFIAHPENGRIEVFANKPRIEALKSAGIEIWCEHGV